MGDARLSDCVHKFTNATWVTPRADGGWWRGAAGRAERHDFGEGVADGPLHTGSGARGPRVPVRGGLGGDEQPGRTEALQPGEAGQLRVRHRADAAAGRWRSLPGEVLHHRDAL